MRSDPNGAEVIIEADGPDKITSVTIDLDGDSEPALVYDGTLDWRYNRRFGPKFVRNGTYTLVVTAQSATGGTATIRCVPGVTVVEK